MFPIPCPVKSSTPARKRHSKQEKVLHQRKRSNAALLRVPSTEHLAVPQRRSSRGRLVSHRGQQQLISDLYLKRRRRSSVPPLLGKQLVKEIRRRSITLALPIKDRKKRHSPVPGLRFLKKQKLLKRAKRSFEAFHKLRKRESRNSFELSSISRLTDTCTSGANLSSTVDELDDNREETAEASYSHSTHQSNDLQDTSSPYQYQENWLNFSSPSKLFESLIFPVSPQEFFSHHWEKQPLVLKRSSNSCQSSESNTGDCASLFSLANMQDLVRDTPVQFGANVNVCRYVKGKRRSMNHEGRLTPKCLSELWKKKATFQFHQPQQFKNTLWRLLTQLETYFGCLVGSNVYITPSGAQGLAPHYDDVEVLILQLEGCKHWRLYSPPLSLPQSYSRDLSQEEIGEPTHDFILEAGDLLYFPRGTIHQADTPTHTSHSTHITISTYQNNAWGNFLSHALYQSLQLAMLSDVDFRKGLPCNIMNIPGGYSQGDGSLFAGRRNTYAGDAKLLVKKLTLYLDMTKALQSYSRDFIASRLPPYTGSEPPGPQGPMPDLDSTVSLTWPDYASVCVHKDEQEQGNGEGKDWVIVYHSLDNRREKHMVLEPQFVEPVGVRFPLHYREALGMLFASATLGNEGVSVSSLPLADREKRNLVMTLWAEGLVHVFHWRETTATREVLI